MDIQWKKIREHLNASNTFREELRAKIYERASLQEKKVFEKYVDKINVPRSDLVFRKTSQKKSLSLILFFRSLGNSFHSFGRWAAIAGGGSLAMLFLIPFLSILTSPSLSASSKSYLSSFSGEVFITRETNTFLATAEQEIFEGDTITTGNASASEIIFFEGSSLRMDNNTSIQIQTLHPEKNFFSSGGVNIYLQEGRTWLQTFHSSEKKLAVVVETNHSSIYPIRANIDISYKGGKEHVRVFSNTALLKLEGALFQSEVVLASDEEIFFTPFDEKVFVKKQEKNIDEKWVTNNKKRSALYKREYFEAISKQMKEKFVIDELSERIHAFIETNPNPEEMEVLVEQLNTLLLLEKSEDLQKNNIQTFFKNTIQENTPENIENTTVVSSINSRVQIKKYTPVLKTTPLKSEKENVQGDNNETNTVATPSKENIPKEISNTTETEPKVLEAISEETPQIKTGKEIAEERAIAQEKIRFEKAAKNFADQVNIFKFKNSRKNHAQNILNKIPDTTENIALLKAMEKDSPKDVKKLIRQKRLSIIRNDKK